MKVIAQGKHRFYSLEDLMWPHPKRCVLAGGARTDFMPTTPTRRAPRDRYDCYGGNGRRRAPRSLQSAGMARFRVIEQRQGQRVWRYAAGAKVTRCSASTPRLHERCGAASRALLERAPAAHGGALEQPLSKVALQRKWVIQGILDSRALQVTSPGGAK